MTRTESIVEAELVGDEHRLESGGASKGAGGQDLRFPLSEWMMNWLGAGPASKAVRSRKRLGFETSFFRRWERPRWDNGGDLSVGPNEPALMDDELLVGGGLFAKECGRATGWGSSPPSSAERAWRWLGSSLRCRRGTHEDLARRFASVR